MDPTEPATLDLGSTKTYSRRQITWHPTGTAEGLLVIRLWERTRRRRGPQAGRLGYEPDLYQVMELDPPPGVIARQFGFLNRLDATQELPYRVLVGRESSCTCRAGLCRVPGDVNTEGCKHKDACIALLESGVLDGGEAEIVVESDTGAWVDFYAAEWEAANAC